MSKNDYFVVCDCSEDIEGLENDDAPSPFLKELTECIDFGDDSMVAMFGTFPPIRKGIAYPIKKPLPSDEGVKEVEYVLNFLNMDFERRPSIAWFIDEFLGIKSNNYTYILLNYLEYKDYTNHGTSIRGTWLQREERLSSTNSDSIKEEIREWLSLE